MYNSNCKPFFVPEKVKKEKTEAAVSACEPSPHHRRPVFLTGGIVMGGMCQCWEKNNVEVLTCFSRSSLDHLETYLVVLYSIDKNECKFYKELEIAAESEEKAIDQAKKWLGFALTHNFCAYSFAECKRSRRIAT